MASALNRLSKDFDPAARQAGEDYFERGTVQIRKSTPGAVRAHVTGSRIYAVRVEREGLDVGYECTCGPFEENGEPCKHIWATLLGAAETGAIETLVPHKGENSVSLVDAALASEEFGDSDEDEEGDDEMVIGEGRRAPAWKQHLLRAGKAMRERLGEAANEAAANNDRQIVYIIDRAAPAGSGVEGLVVELNTQEIRKDDSYAPLKPLRLGASRVNGLPDASDRDILRSLAGAERADAGLPRAGQNEIPRRYLLPQSALAATLKRLCATRRCMLRRDREELEPVKLSWDDGRPWEFRVDLAPTDEHDVMMLRGVLRRGDGEASGDEQTLDPAEVDLALADGGGAAGVGVIIAAGKVALLEHNGAFDLIAVFRETGEVIVPKAHAAETVRELYNLPRLPALNLPETLRIAELSAIATPRLAVRPSDSEQAEDVDERLVAELAFDYVAKPDDDGAEEIHAEVSANTPQPFVLTPGSRHAIRRDRVAELEASRRLERLGFRLEDEFDGPRYRIAPAKLPRAVIDLVGAGWRVEAEGNLYRSAGEMRFEVRSGIDWFDLSGKVQFGDISIGLPRLLEAVRKGERTIALEDGTMGVVPEEWFGKYATLAALGQEQGDDLRFAKQQIGFLDALLATMPEANVDETFALAREKLATFASVLPVEAPPTFVGELRPYQKDGIGWMEFLRSFNFGGCLADDMGLGKTVQVLALLEARRANGDNKGRASLVVVPRSLVFNWKQEAQRFAPSLRMLDHSGTQRQKTPEHLNSFDVIVTTYGTLRLDISFLKDYQFDYVILDEAQAIKNASTESAKTVRLLKSAHRLALSGTPIENHIGELWSLFEFLNPGMLGRSSVLNMMSGPTAAADPEARQLLARSLRPFILRRTKEQVAADLPEKLEQTIACELDVEQRKLYDELRAHYRTSLLDRIAREGINAAKIQILEALLRLRQAACHPGLIDKSQSNGPSAKLDQLIPRLVEATQEGHKVLVFSQFTSFLAIVKQKLDEQGLTYEYLDGKTRDRQERVERFQTDPDCKLFLVSLRAGGLGLNLTAADYVFLLDPWWNPAVEAQAIDRAHRIGQTRSVFAYRLIAKDTVEEKVLELQSNKRDLADAIINADNSLIRSLGKEDLELLLS